MTRSNPQWTPASRASLANDLALAEQEGRSLSTLKALAKRYSVVLRGGSSFQGAKNVVVAHLRKLHDIAKPNSEGSAAAAASSEVPSATEGSPVGGRRLSYSQALASPAAHRVLGDPSTCKVLTPLRPASVLPPAPAAQVGGPQAPTAPSAKENLQPSPPAAQQALLPPRAAASSPRAAAPAAPTAVAAANSPIQWQRSPLDDAQPPEHTAASPRPAQPSPKLKAPAAAPAAGERGVAASSCHGSSPQQGCACSCGQQLAEMAAQLAEHKVKLARLEQQQQATAGMAANLAATVQGLEQSAATLQDQAQHSQRVEEEVRSLSSRQQQLAERQERGECQQGIVLKVSKPFAESGLAPAVQAFLAENLGLQVTVLRVQRLDSHSGASRQGNRGRQQRDSSASPRGGRRAAYKVMLASSEQRDAVLRAKAAALKRTAISIDVLLTRQQLVSKLARLPAAKQAAAAGRRVQWRYDRLFIDGTEFGGSDTLPSPRQRQQRAAAGSQTATAAVPAAAAGAAAAAPAAPASTAEEGWQEVRGRKGRGQASGQQHQPRQQGAGSRPQQPQQGQASRAPVALTPPASPAASRAQGGAPPRSHVGHSGASSSAERSSDAAAQPGAGGVLSPRASPAPNPQQGKKKRRRRKAAASSKAAGGSKAACQHGNNTPPASNPSTPRGPVGPPSSSTARSDSTADAAGAGAGPASSLPFPPRA